MTTQPTYVNAGSVANLTTTGTPSYPASIVAGNLLLLHVASMDSTLTSATHTALLAAGWTAGPATSGGGVNDLRVYFKVATGAETGNVSLATTAGTNGHARIEQYSAPVATVTVDAAATASASAAARSSMTFSMTIATGATLVTVAVPYAGAGGVTTSAVTWGGVPMTGYTRVQSSANSTNRLVDLWFLVNPTPGTANIVVTMSGSTDCDAAAVSWFGTDTITPLGTAAISGATTGTSDSLSPVGGTFVIAAEAVRSTTAVTVGGTPTTVLNRVTGAFNNDWNAVTYNAVPYAPSASWATSDEHAAFAVPINPARTGLSIVSTSSGIDALSDTGFASTSGGMTGAVDDFVIAIGASVGTFTAPYSGFTITATGFTVPGSTNVRGSSSFSGYQWGVQDKPISTGTSGSFGSYFVGNCTSVTGVGLFIIIRATSSLTPGMTVKVKQSGVFVDGTLRVRRGGTWVTPTSINVVGSVGRDVRPNLPWDLPLAKSVPVTYGYGASAATATVTLPWDPTSRPVLAHYFTQFNRSIDNKNALTDATEYYRKNWVKPGGIEGSKDWRLVGGWLRDRHIPRAPLTGSWQTTDVQWEIQAAIDARIDGFFIDLLALSTSSNHYQTILRLFDAADAIEASTGKRFWLVPMADGTAQPSASVHVGALLTGAEITASANALADFVALFRNRRAFWRPGSNGGKFILPVFAPDYWPGGISNPSSDRVSFWSQVKSRLETTWSVPTDLWFCYVSVWNTSTAAGALNSLAYGHGRWGDRDANAVAGSGVYEGTAASTCHASPYSKKWMHFVAPGDSRPNSGSTNYLVWENKGSLTFQGSWEAALGRDGDLSDMVQMTTWSDLGEHAHVMPSVNHGYVWLDLNTYWMHKFKTGAYPTVVRDGLYLFHRVHPTTLHSFPGTLQTKFGAVTGGTSFADIVEVRAYLTTAATIQLLVDGVVTQTASGVAGMNRFEWALPSSGVVSAQAIRSGSTVPGTVVTSNITLGVTQVADDFHYRAFSSLRQYTGT